MTKPKAKKPVERKFKHGEVIGKVEDMLLLDILDNLGNAYTAAWKKVGSLVGLAPYNLTKPNGTPRDVGLDTYTGELKYLGRTKK